MKQAAAGYDMFIGGKFDDSFGPVVFSAMAAFMSRSFGIRSICYALPIKKKLKRKFTS